MTFQSTRDRRALLPPVLRVFRILLVLGTAAPAGCAGTEGVRGVVVDTRESPLSGIEVHLYGPRDDGSSARPRFSSGTTDDRGRFTLDAQRGRGELLELRGPEGIGRVRVDRPRTPVTVTYPVRTTVILPHDNDPHFNFNHLEEFESAVEGLRSRYENVFLLNAGDIFIRRRERWNEPTEDFYARHSRRIIDLMNRFGYDAMTLGNHELEPVEDLTRDALAAARFPLLAANVEVTTDLLCRDLPRLPFS